MMHFSKRSLLALLLLCCLLLTGCHGAQDKDAFLLPAGYTRFGSVLDLILYALSAL